MPAAVLTGRLALIGKPALQLAACSCWHARTSCPPTTTDPHPLLRCRSGTWCPMCRRSWSRCGSTAPRPYTSPAAGDSSGWRWRRRSVG